MTPPKMETFDRLTAGEPLTTADLREIGRRMASTPEPLHDESTLDAMKQHDMSKYLSDVKAGHYMPVAPTPRDKSEIDVALEGLRHEAGTSLALTIEVFSRLAPVLNPPTELNPIEEEFPVRSRLAHSIERESAELRKCSAYLRCILDRLAI